MLGDEPIGPELVPAQGLEDEQVVELVELLGKVDLAQLLAAAEPSEGLVEVQPLEAGKRKGAKASWKASWQMGTPRKRAISHGQVGKVGHAGNRLEEPEPLDRAAIEQKVEDPAEGAIGLNGIG